MATQKVSKTDSTDNAKSLAKRKTKGGSVKTRTRQKDIQISLDHVESALMAYLKPFFPEAAEITGINMKLPLDSTKRPAVDVSIYYNVEITGSVKDAEASTD